VGNREGVGPRFTTFFWAWPRCELPRPPTMMIRGDRRRPAGIDWRVVAAQKATPAGPGGSAPVLRTGRSPPLFAVPGFARAALVSRRLPVMTIVERAQIALTGD
jgi:hypothetical protein